VGHAIQFRKPPPARPQQNPESKILNQRFPRFRSWVWKERM